MAAETRSPSTRLDRTIPAGRVAIGSGPWLLQLLGASLLVGFLFVSAGLLVRRWLFVEFRPPNPWLVLAVAGLVAIVGGLTNAQASVSAANAPINSRRFLRPLVFTLLATVVSVRGGHLLPLVVLWATALWASRPELRHVEDWGIERLRRLYSRMSEPAARKNATGERGRFEVDPAAKDPESKAADKGGPALSPDGSVEPVEGAVVAASANAYSAVHADEVPVWTEGTDQHWVRGRDESGVHFCSGRARVPVSAGQRMVSWHAVLCPAFEKTPEIEVEVVGGLDAECELTQVLRHGWRVELRLQRVAEQDAEILLEFYAWEAGQSAEDPEVQSDAA